MRRWGCIPFRCRRLPSWLRDTLLGLGLTITDSQPRVLLNDKLDDYARLMHVTRRTAQRHFTDDYR